jgi:hypothetical protein
MVDIWYAYYSNVLNNLFKHNSVQLRYAKTSRVCPEFF